MVNNVELTVIEDKYTIYTYIYIIFVHHLNFELLSVLPIIIIYLYHNK